MFIELADLLLCPCAHEPTYCVITSNEMRGRRVVRGVVGCPVCERQYPIIDGVVAFGPDPLLGAGCRSDDLTTEEMPEAGDLQALLGLSGPGGYVVLIGSVARVAEQLAGAMSGVHFVALNPPPEISESETLSVLQAGDSIPIRSSTVRGVVVGREYAREPWLSEAGRVLLKGRNLVVAEDDLEIPSIDEVAVGKGLWVGRRIS